MSAKEIIRLNLKIHPDKDPNLYQLLESISKESRVRRVINLANNGIVVENLGVSPLDTPRAVVPVSTTALQDTAKKDVVDSPPIADVIETHIGIQIEEGELDAIADMFGSR